MTLLKANGPQGVPPLASPASVEHASGGRPQLPSSSAATRISRPLAKLLDTVPINGSVLDVGCLGWKLHAARPELRHAGCDFEDSAFPDKADFRRCNVDREPLPWPDDSFDFVVASHVLEHLVQPISAFGEIYRVCKPGGVIYLEAPSDRSLVSPPFCGGMHGFYSYWDDPTHVRPWSPRALYRLLLSFNCEPLACDYLRSTGARLLLPVALLRHLISRDDDLLTQTWWDAVGFSAFAIGRKPASISGAHAFRYCSLQAISEDQVRRHFANLETRTATDQEIGADKSRGATGELPSGT